MRFSCFCACLLLTWFAQSPLLSQQGVAAVPIRGDANANGRRDVGDAQYLLAHFFGTGRPAVCAPVMDINRSGRVNITDVIFLLQALYVSDRFSIDPLTVEEQAECEQPLLARRGEARFYAPDSLGNDFHCGLCHDTEAPGAEPGSGPLLPGHGLGDAAARPSYFNGRLDSLLDAVNQCRVHWMEAPPLGPDEPSCLEYLAFLDSLTQPGATAEPLSCEVVAPGLAGPARGDPIAGCALFTRACSSCHGGAEDEGVAGLASSLWTRQLTADTVRRHVRLSGPRNLSGDSAFADELLGNGMPFWTPERMSDLQLEDLAAYLELASDPAARSCESLARVPPRLLRSGRFQMVMHGVRGRVEHWSDGTIRLRDFFYDGGGPRDVVVWVYHQDIDNFHAILDGVAVSAHLGRARPYLGETLDIALPEAILPSMFNSVAIWCTSVQSTYARTWLLAD